MFGLEDFSVFLGFILIILSAAISVIYGIINWNKEENIPNTLNYSDSDSAIRKKA